jgi:hypothetical protein
LMRFSEERAALLALTGPSATTVADVERDYWTAVVQILPVLGLALVLEARNLVQAYQHPASELALNTRRTRRVQLGLLIVSGLALSFTRVPQLMGT